MRLQALILFGFALLLGVNSLLRAEEQVGRATLEVPPAPIFNEEQPTPIGYYENGVLVELPSLEEELQWHGGAHLYEPSDVTDPPLHYHDRHAEERLRLPENWQEPQPLISSPNDYLGPGLICWHPDLKWFGYDPNMWEPRLVLHGSYEVFGTVFEQNNERRDGIGHQLLLDLDLQLTGTERFHVQFRPVGEENSGGSFWQLNEPDQYFDNSTEIPQRWWFEGELQSIFGPWLNDERHQLDVNFTVGRFPFRLHNGLLMDDEITGVVLGKNTFTSLPFSNLNMQAFYAIDEVDAHPNSADLIGLHLSADYRHVFIEATYAHLNRTRATDFSTNYLALSATKFFGPLSVAGRTMYRFADDSSVGNGNLQVIETAFTHIPDHKIECLTGIEKTVSYINAFYASENWTTIAGGNLDRLRNAFAVNPLVNLAAGGTPHERYGVAIGSQLFRHHQDESFIPEIAYEEVSSEASFGVGLRYRRKVNSRQFIELRGIKNWSEAAALRREGLFASTVVIF
ncbi:hypothetical protein OAH05_01610 [bacterium]|jgi:hypothetical protein|nr:hypothetical protein [bacterium]